MNKIIYKDIKGFTLVELMVVIIILSVLTGIAVPSYITLKNRARESATEAEMVNIAKALELYNQDEESYPLTSEGIETVEGTFVKDVPVNDKWGRAYSYNSDGSSYELRSSGVDGTSGNSDDIVIANGVMTAQGGYGGSGDDPSVLFSSSFDNMDGIESIQGSWSAEDGLLKPTTSYWQNRAIFGEEDWNDYEIEVDATLTDLNSDNKGGYGIYYRSTKNEEEWGVDGYIFQYDPGLGDRFAVNKVSGRNSEERLEMVRMSEIIPGFNIYNTSHKIKISVQGNQHVISITDADGNEHEIFNFEDDTYTSGAAGFRSWRYSDVDFEDVSVSEL